MRRISTGKTTNINVAVPADMKAAVEALALKHDVSTSNYVRRVLRRHIAEQQQIKRAA